MITGIDLSEKNGEVRWNDFGFGDVQFAFIKATEAIDSIDREFERNIQYAKELGIVVGAYHWLHPRLHVGQQAELFIKTVRSFKGLLPPRSLPGNPSSELRGDGKKCDDLFGHC